MTSSFHFSVWILSSDRTGLGASEAAEGLLERGARPCRGAPAPCPRFLVSPLLSRSPLPPLGPTRLLSPPRARSVWCRFEREEGGGWDRRGRP